jgi:hypothetical protein
MKASTGSFASEAYFLAVDDRPSTPSVSINYFTEYTNETISSDMAYSADSTFAVSSAGTGSKITVAPGKDLYFKVKATSGNFASGVYFLTIPERPATPTATINYTAEATVESFPATVEYSKSPTYSAPISCTGTPIVLTPGQDLWIWVKPTLASFASMDYHLVVPERPYLEYTGDAIVNTSFSVKAILQDFMTGFDLADILVTNGQAENLRNDNSFDVVPDQKGDVHVVISINSFGGASFASNEVMVYYDSTLSAIPRMDKDSYTVYPNPSHDGIFNIRTMVNAPYTIDVISPEGSIIKSIIAGETECQQIDLQGLPKGMFYLRIRANEKVHIHKVIME